MADVDVHEGGDDGSGALLPVLNTTIINVEEVALNVSNSTKQQELMLDSDDDITPKQNNSALQPADQMLYNPSLQANIFRKNKLGVVTFKDPNSGMCKRGLVLPDGKILGDRKPFINDCSDEPVLDAFETFENTLEWLEDAPFLQPEVDSAMVRAGHMASEGLQRLEMASEDAMDAVYQGLRGRRRSRSEIQCPSTNFSNESVHFINSVEDEWNDSFCTQKYDCMGMAIDEREEEAETETEADDHCESACTRQVENHHLDHGAHFVSTTNASSDGDSEHDYRSNVMVASRLVFGTKCNRVCLVQNKDPTTLIADCILRSASPSLVTANRGLSYWNDAINRAGVRLTVSCETYVAQNNFATTGVPNGQLVLTPAFGLPLRYILHLVSGNEQQGELPDLKALYHAVLKRAQQEGYATLVLPFIGDVKTYSIADSAAALVNVVSNACRVEEDIFGLEKLVVVCENDQELAALQTAIKHAASNKMSFDLI